MNQILTIVQLVVGILLSAAILLQQKGDGLGAGFGGTGGGIAATKRGVDLFLHRASVILALVFFAIGIVMLFLA